MGHSHLLPAPLTPSSEFQFIDRRFLSVNQISLVSGRLTWGYHHVTAHSPHPELIKN